MPRIKALLVTGRGVSARKYGYPRFVPAVSRLLALTLLAFIACLPARAASPNDVARYLAGMEPSRGSPLEQATRDPLWRAHAREMDRVWSALESNQINRVRVWASSHLPPPSPSVFYMFSGPDFLHADAFFPNASTYVLAGLEPLGALPSAVSIPPGQLQAMRASLGNFITYGYFITKEMGQQFDEGTLPVLYIFLARAGKYIQDVTYVRLNANGTVSVLKGAKGANGVQIIFSGRDRRPRKLYYFRTDLSDSGISGSGILKFMGYLGTGDSLVKSASFLMHTGGFSKVRNFLLSHSNVIIQDDSGIALRYFDRSKWRLYPFGQYLTPIEVFKDRYQPEMAQLFARAEPINFGIGYRWHPTRTNVLLAIRGNGRAPGVTPPRINAPQAAAPGFAPQQPQVEQEPRRRGILRRLFGGDQ